MNPRKIILLLSLSALSALSVPVYCQEATAPDTSGVNGNIFEKVDKEAEFPGGFDAWKKYLEQNLNPNVPVDNSAPVGLYTVVIQFVVDRDGTVSDIKPLTKMGYGMEQEVVRILRKSGPWIPAIQHERTVRAYRKQPVTFMVSDEQFEISSKTPYVLFTGTDNEITLEVDKVKSGDIQLTISQGTIAPTGDGKYIVRVSKAGRIIIYIYNAKKKKTIGSTSFQVKDAKDK